MLRYGILERAIARPYSLTRNIPIQWGTLPSPLMANGSHREESMASLRYGRSVLEELSMSCLSISLEASITSHVLSSTLRLWRSPVGLPTKLCHIGIWNHSKTYAPQAWILLISSISVFMRIMQIFYLQLRVTTSDFGMLRPTSSSTAWVCHQRPLQIWKSHQIAEIVVYC